MDAPGKGPFHGSFPPAFKHKYEVINVKRAVKLLETVQKYLVVIFFVIMCCSSFFQVLNRNIFKLPISWTEELSRYCMIWMTMVGTCISLRSGSQMAVVIFEKRIKGKALKILQIFDSVMVFVFSVVVMVSVTQLISKQAASGQLSPALRIPMQYVTVGIFLGMLFFSLFELEQIIRMIKDKTPAQREQPEENGGDEV